MHSLLLLVDVIFVVTLSQKNDSDALYFAHGLKVLLQDKPLCLVHCCVDMFLEGRYIALQAYAHNACTLC